MYAILLAKYASAFIPRGDAIRRLGIALWIAAAAMPESERLVVTETPSSAAEKSNPRPPPAPSSAPAATREDAIKQVSLPLDDPSEYRPELAPGGTLENLGKEADNFRVYYEVFMNSVSKTLT